MERCNEDGNRNELIQPIIDGSDEEQREDHRKGLYVSRRKSGFGVNEIDVIRFGTRARAVEVDGLGLGPGMQEAR